MNACPSLHVVWGGGGCHDHSAVRAHTLHAKDPKFDPQQLRLKFLGLAGGVKDLSKSGEPLPVRPDSIRGLDGHLVPLSRGFTGFCLEHHCINAPMRTEGEPCKVSAQSPALAAGYLGLQHMDSCCRLKGQVCSSLLLLSTLCHVSANLGSSPPPLPSSLSTPPPRTADSTRF